MIRIPLASFRDGNQPLPLTDIERIIFEFHGSGLIAIDDIHFSE